MSRRRFLGLGAAAAAVACAPAAAFAAPRQGAAGAEAGDRVLSFVNLHTPSSNFVHVDTGRVRYW